jgi:hypothetical protein
MNGEIALAGYSLPLPVRLILKTARKEFTGIAFIVLCHCGVCKILSVLAGN